MIFSQEGQLFQLAFRHAHGPACIDITATCKYALPPSPYICLSNLTGKPTGPKEVPKIHEIVAEYSALQLGESDAKVILR